MFVLDTNILSAITAAQPMPEVAAWLARQGDDRIFTTSICQAEILAGLAVMPKGRRRAALESAAAGLMSAGSTDAACRPAIRGKRRRVLRGLITTLS